MKKLRLVGMILSVGVLFSSIGVLGASQTNETKLVQMTNEAEYIQLLKDKNILVPAEELSEHQIKIGLENRIPNTQDISDTDMFNESEATANEATTSAEKGDYSKTNVQVEGVDEEDTLKNDDRYIYKIINSSSIVIMDTKPNLHIEGRIELKESEANSYYFENMFLEGNQLIILGEERRPYEPRKIPITFQNNKIQEIGRVYTHIRIYDITNKSAPQLVRQVSVQGTQQAIRKIGDTLYVVNNNPMIQKAINVCTTEDLLPAYKDSLLGDEVQLLNPNQVYDVPWADHRPMLNSITIIASIHLKQSKSIEMNMLLGDVSEVYMSKEALFLEIGGKVNTISRFNVEQQSLNYVGTGVIDGYLYNQFAMDLYDNYLRVATTGYDSKTHQTTNNLFIFDKNMNQVSSLTGLAPTERIYSARFEGKTGYLVTYKQMDPLFVIDLSNPMLPKVKGELKIPGVSTYLHPISDQFVVGIGVATMDEDEEAYKYKNLELVSAGIKLSLFDVSNPNMPKEVNKIILGTMGSYSSAQYNHKAVTVHKGKSMLAIPVYIIYNESRQLNNFKGAYVFAVENGKLVGKAKLGKLNETQKGYYNNYNEDRVCYIGDRLYYLYDNKINEYNIDDFKRLQTITLQ